MSEKTPCPACGKTDIDVVETTKRKGFFSRAHKTFFICKNCGCNFWPSELGTSSKPNERSSAVAQGFPSASSQKSEPVRVSCPGCSSIDFYTIYQADGKCHYECKCCGRVFAPTETGGFSILREPSSKPLSVPSSVGTRDPELERMQSWLQDSVAREIDEREGRMSPERDRYYADRARAREIDLVRELCGLENQYPDGDLDNSIRKSEEAVTKDANDINAHRTLGVLYLLKGQYREARAVCDRAVELDPKDAQANYYLAVSYYMSPNEDIYEDYYDMTQARAYLGKALHFGLPKEPYINEFLKNVSVRLELAKDNLRLGYDPFQRGIEAERRQRELREIYKEYRKRIRRSEGWPV